jgi:hypothetical protein
MSPRAELVAAHAICRRDRRSTLSPVTDDGLGCPCYTEPMDTQRHNLLLLRLWLLQMRGTLAWGAPGL